jgi:alkylated DNA repair dioxygenase AlkB
LIESVLHYQFNICLVNYYATGKDSIGWHSDNEEKGDIECIASISIGSTRNFTFRKCGKTDIVLNIPLESGCMVVMDDGCQKHYEHSILQDKSVKEPRLNITFRKFKYDTYTSS